MSPRTREVAALVREGLSNKQIGQRLGIGDNAVRDHVALAKAWSRSPSRVDLALWVERGGLRA